MSLVCAPVRDGAHDPPGGGGASPRSSFKARPIVLRAMPVIAETA
jgi:hypothetical protein